MGFFGLVSLALDVPLGLLAKKETYDPDQANLHETARARDHYFRYRGRFNVLGPVF